MKAKQIVWLGDKGRAGTVTFRVSRYGPGRFLVVSNVDPLSADLKSIFPSIEDATTACQRALNIFVADLMDPGPRAAQ